MKTKITKNNQYVADERGSLGLLALGYKGLRAWREKIDASKKTKNDKEKK